MLRPGHAQVERYFITTASLSQYWISMFKVGTQYYFGDGSFIGGIIPRRGNPYVHVCTSACCT